MRVEITLETLNMASQMVYRRWSEEVAYLAAVKADTSYEGTPDWQAFHAIRVNNHEKLEAKWREAKDEMARVLKYANMAV
jgi:hypothetical protein